MIDSVSQAEPWVKADAFYRDSVQSFLNRDTEPTVDEQAAIYGEVLTAFADRKVVVRTLDAGSDKPLKFAGHPDEANPALGVRGIRIADGKHFYDLEYQLPEAP